MRLGFRISFVIFNLSFIIAAQAAAVPIINNEELTSLTDTTAIITWVTTNETADTKVYYGVGSTATVYTSSESVNYHYAILTGLNQGTAYNYYVKSGTTESVTKVFTTLTPPSGQYLFTFASLADPQYAMGKADTGGARGRPYSKSAEILGATITEINKYSPAFTILKGDVIESSIDTGDIAYGEYINTTIPGDTENIKQKFDGLTKEADATAKYYPIPGNHDKALTSYTGGITSSWYTKNLHLLYTGATSADADSTLDSCFNYSFDYNGYKFIMLDSVKSNLSAEVNATYLSAQLSSAEANGKKCFIFLHNPVTDVRTEGIPDEVLKEVTGTTVVDYTKIQIINTTEVQALITTYKDIIAGVFSGHIHDHNYSTVAGVPCVRTASGLQFPTGFNVYKVYSNGFMQSFYKVPNYSEIARLVITSEAGYSDTYWEQFALGPNNARNFSHTLSAAAPSVNLTTPASLGTGISLNENIQIKFTKAMSQTDTQNAITFSPDVASKSYSWISSDTVRISHADFSPSTAYTVTISTAAKDSSGTAMASSYSFSFTTSSQTDSAPPNAAFNQFTLNITNDNLPTFTGIATDELSAIVSIECRIDNGSWIAANSLDGAYNSKTETFSFLAPAPLVRSVDAHTIEARCLDAAQNIKTSAFDNYSFYVIGDKPEINIDANSLNIISGDPIDSSPSFEVRVVSNKGLTLNPLYAIIDSGTPVSLVKTFNADQSIVTSVYNPTLTDGTHSLRISTIDDQGNLSTREVVGLVVQSAQEVSLQGSPLSYPNPYRGVGNIFISYTLSKSSNITITVHDLMGNQLVRKTYTSGGAGAKAGYNEITWDGKTDSGEELGNGIYVYLVVADGKILDKGKITVVR